MLFVRASENLESKTRTYHGRVEAERRTSRWQTETGPGRTERRRIGSPRIRLASRGTISIFGPIFKVEDRSEDPNLRIAEKS